VEAKTQIYNHLPERPAMPDLAFVKDYLPEVPEMPDIPLPAPLEKAKQRMNSANSDHVSPMIQQVNYIIIIFSVASMSLQAFNELLVFRPRNIINFNKKASSAAVPFVWTFVTSVFVETNLLFLVIHLATINYVVVMNRQTFETAWTKKEFLKMLCICAILSTFTHFVLRVLIFSCTRNLKSYSAFGYSSINFIVIALLLGLCQQANRKAALTNMPGFQKQIAKREFDTAIPFISSTIKIPYSILPQLYVVASLGVSFLFEQPFDLRVMLDFFWIWFYLRYFMRTQDNQIGDFSPEFAFVTFFPDRFKKPVMVISEFSYALFNMCGFVNFMHRYMQGLPTSNEASEAIAKD
jgi:hypothetical protein